MDCAEAENEVAAVNGNDFAVRKKLGESVEGHAIIRIIEDREENKFVGDIKVCVAGGQALSVKENWCGHGKCFDAERFAVLIFHGFEERKIFLQGRVVCIGSIFFDDGDDGCGVGEAGKIVNVSMSIVASDTAFQPENIRHAKIIAEELFVIAFCEAEIALLNFALQAFFRSEECAKPVNVNRPAFENHALTVVRW